MTERFKMAAEDLLTANRTLSADDGEVNTPHERLALGCQVRARYGGKDKVMQAGFLSANILTALEPCIAFVSCARGSFESQEPQTPSRQLAKANQRHSLCFLEMQSL